MSETFCLLPRNWFGKPFDAGSVPLDSISAHIPGRAPEPLAGSSFMKLTRPGYVCTGTTGCNVQLGTGLFAQRPETRIWFRTGGAHYFRITILFGVLNLVIVRGGQDITKCKKLEWPPALGNHGLKLGGLKVGACFIDPTGMEQQAV